MGLPRAVQRKQIDDSKVGRHSVFFRPNNTLVRPGRRVVDVREDAFIPDGTRRFHFGAKRIAHDDNQRARIAMRARISHLAAELNYPTCRRHEKSIFFNAFRDRLVDFMTHPECGKRFAEAVIHMRRRWGFQSYAEQFARAFLKNPTREMAENLLCVMQIGTQVSTDETMYENLCFGHFYKAITGDGALIHPGREGVETTARELAIGLTRAVFYEERLAPRLHTLGKLGDDDVRPIEPIADDQNHLYTLFERMNGSGYELGRLNYFSSAMTYIAEEVLLAENAVGVARQWMHMISQHRVP